MKIYCFKQVYLHDCRHAHPDLDDVGLYLYSSEEKATNAIRSFIGAFLNSNIFCTRKPSKDKNKEIQKALKGNVKEMVSTFNKIFNIWGCRHYKIDYYELETDSKFDFSAYKSFHY